MMTCDSDKSVIPSDEENQDNEISDYERIRLRSIEENRRILLELGLIKPFQEKQPVLKKCGHVKARVSLKRKAISNAEEINENVDTENNYKRRFSQRLRGIKADESYVLNSNEEGLSFTECKASRKVKRDNIYGPINGIEIGHSWLTRLECSMDGVHRPTVAGIHAGPDGAYSLALSGGYEDDVDFGESFTYTGSGGRDLRGTKANPKNLRTASQSCDQTLNKMNSALVTSVEKGTPVRVIRGYKLNSAFAPEEGYRYDGIYRVKKWWLTPGKSGFLTYKFALQRDDNQGSPPWDRLKQD